MTSRLANNHRAGRQPSNNSWVRAAHSTGGSSDPRSLCSGQHPRSFLRESWDANSVTDAARFFVRRLIN